MKASVVVGAVLLLGAAVAACSGPQGSERVEGAEGAALNVGMGVAAAPLHRAATGCFTPCAYGTVCDEQNGVCVHQEEATKPAASGLPGAEPAPSSSANAGPALTPAAAPSGVAPLCSPACPADHTCEMDAGRSVCKRR